VPASLTPLVIATKLEVKYGFRAVAMLLIYSLLQQYVNRSWISFEDLLSHKISLPYTKRH